MMTVPPCRGKRRLKHILIRTIAARMNGSAIEACQCILCRFALNPAFSRLLMNIGNSQKDSVSGDAKLFWISLRVNEVGIFRLEYVCSGRSGWVTRTFVRAHVPSWSLAVSESYRRKNLLSDAFAKIMTSCNEAPWFDTLRACITDCPPLESTWRNHSPVEEMANRLLKPLKLRDSSSW